MNEDESFDLGQKPTASSHSTNGTSDVPSDIETDSGVTTDTDYTGTSTSTFINNTDGEDVYRDGERGTKNADEADQVNIRKLVRENSLSDIRWLYRNTFAKVLVDKPIDDSLKNGCSIKNDPSESIKEAWDEWKSYYKTVEKKARRDGMAVLYRIYSETGTQSPSDPPTRASVTGLDGFNVLTVDDLANVNEGEIEDDVPEEYGLRDNGTYNYECRSSGLVVSKKINDTSWNDPIGVVIGQRDDTDGLDTYQFVHHERCQFFTWNKEVDGDFSRDDNDVYTELRRNEESTIGKWEGDSVLQSCYHLIKDLFKGNWAIMQTVFRYASPLYDVTVPARDCQTEEEYQEVTNTFNNLNAKSEVFLPEGYELELNDTEGQLDPEGYFDPIFDQICASTEMTRSVLFGTQAGTVSGSSTDRSNYENQVVRLQNERIERKFEDHVRALGRVDNSTVPNFALGYEMSWNELFQLDELDKAENFRTISNALTQLANQYALTPSEVRSLTNEMIQDLEYETDLSEDLDIEDFDFMADIELASNGNQRPMNLEAAQEVLLQNASSGVEPESQGNPRTGNNVEGSPPAEGTGEAS